jgi:hypothetical protein
MASKDNDLLITKILGTPAGQQVLQAFWFEFYTTLDFMRSVERAKEEAEKNGTLVPLQIAAIVDFLTKFLGPAAEEALRRRQRKK